MSKINSLAELQEGDVVYLFGLPFYGPVVSKHNPFVVTRLPTIKNDTFYFQSLHNANIEQGCFRLRDETRIYKADNFTTEDKAELILEGFGDLLNE